MDDPFQALAEPRRRAILHLLNGPELAAGDIAARFEVTRTAISQHLRVLRDSGLVTERREGTRRFYRARPEGLAEVRAYLDEFWGEALDRLRAVAEAEHATVVRRRRRGAA